MKREKRTAVAAGVTSCVCLALIVVLGNVLASVFVASPLALVYWLLCVLFAGATFVLAHALGQLWRAATHQRLSPAIATISSWATMVLFFANAILWAADDGNEGYLALVAWSGLVIGGITAVTSGIVALATLPQASHTIDLRGKQ